MAKPAYTGRQRATFLIGLAVLLCGLWQINPGLGVTAMGATVVWAARHIQ